MENIWFNEELVIDQTQIERLEESDARAHGQRIISRDEFNNLSRLTVLAEEPIAARISKDLLHNGVKGSTWVVTLRYILNSPDNLHFMRILCESYLEPVLDRPVIDSTTNSRLIVIDYFPHIIYEENEKSFNVNLSPKIKLFDLEVSLAEIGTKLPSRFSPKIVGYPFSEGKQRVPSPYWEIIPQNQNLKGELFFYLAIFKPDEFSIGVRSRIQAVVQHHIGPIPYGPLQKTWDSRPLFVIR